MEDIMEHEMKQFVLETWNTHIEAKKIEPDLEMMQPVKEHQEVHREEAAVVPVRGPRKRRRVRKLAAERRQKPKEGTLGYSGSRKGVTVAGKRTSRHATVAWRKEKWDPGTLWIAEDICHRQQRNGHL
jgi:hypothetical protein